MATVAKNARSTTINLVTGSAGPFNLGFRLFDDDAVDVFVNGVRSTDWTLSSSYVDGADDAATITFGTPLAAGTEIIIEANLTPGRASDYIGSDPLLVQKMNIELARVWSSVSDLHRGVARSLRGFATLDPVGGLDLSAIAEAETYATQAEAAKVAAEAARDLAVAAQENLYDAWRGAWMTATAYVQGDLAAESGTTYICLVDHTSGTFATDLAALKWAIFAQQGAPGSGTGDVVAANNGTEFTPTTFRNNLELPSAPATVVGGAGAPLTGLPAITPVYFWRLGAAFTSSFPGQTTGDLLLAWTYDANNTIHIGIRMAATPVLYMRSKIAGVWGSWDALATQAYVDAAVAALAVTGSGGPVATTSGTSADINSIPAGVNEIEVLLNGVSVSSTGNLLVQFKVSGAAVTSGYVSRSVQMGSGGNAYSPETTGGMIVRNGSAGAALYGILRLRRIPGTDDWVQDHSVQREGATWQVVGGGRVTLAGDPDGIRLKPDGIDSFDGGTFAIRFKT